MKEWNAEWFVGVNCETNCEFGRLCEKYGSKWLNEKIIIAVRTLGSYVIKKLNPTAKIKARKPPIILIVIPFSNRTCAFVESRAISLIMYESTPRPETEPNMTAKDTATA